MSHKKVDWSQESLVANWESRPDTLMMESSLRAAVEDRNALVDELVLARCVALRTAFSRACLAVDAAVTRAVPSVTRTLSALGLV